MRCRVRAPLAQKVLPLPMVPVRPTAPGSSSTMICDAAVSMGVVARLFWFENEYMLATPLAVDEVCMRYTGPAAEGGGWR